MKRALVTGAAGFVGQWLCRALIREGWEVSGASLTSPSPTGVLSPEERAAVQWMLADLRTATVIGDVMDATRPDVVFHLAGLAFVPALGNDPVDGFQTNVGTSVALLAAARSMRDRTGVDPTILVVGSCEQYGRHDPREGALAETAERRPNTWYAASKDAQETMALGAFRADGLRIVATRSFNQAGAGQAREFLLPSLVHRVHALRGQPVGAQRLVLGNLDSTRDFLHVADGTEAYVALAEQGVPGEVYNVCSGNGVSVENLAREVCVRAGVEAELVSDPSLRRPIDVPWSVGDNAKLRATTGWTPRRSRSDIIDDLLHAPSH